MLPERSVAQRVLLVGVDLTGGAGRGRLWSVDESLDELARLAETAGAVVVGREIQRRSAPDPTSLIGEGKVAAIDGRRAAEGIDVVIFDEELSPVQQRNLEKGIGCSVIDRTTLILDIFAERARSKEARLQVELAQLEYRLPRLTGRGVELSRLGGGIGTRGPGETKLEVDRRRIRERISHLRHELKEVAAHRARLREARGAGIAVVAICGYTNAGKSTLLNALTRAGVLAEDRLFATLDATSRRVEPPAGEPFVLVDTVGFIQHLPHHLVAAFRSTLEEVTQADLLLHVVDASHPKREEQMQAVAQVLAELGAAERPVLLVLNKIDAPEGAAEAPHLLRRYPEAVAVSALTGAGLEVLLVRIQAELANRRERLVCTVPYHRSALVALIHDHGQVLAERHTAEGTYIEADLERAVAAKVRHELAARP